MKLRDGILIAATATTLVPIIYFLSKSEAYRINERSSGSIVTGQAILGPGTEKNYATALAVGFAAEQIANEKYSGEAAFTLDVEETKARITGNINGTLQHLLYSADNQQITIAKENNTYTITHNKDPMTIYRHTGARLSIDNKANLLPRQISVTAKNGIITGAYQYRDNTWDIKGTYDNQGKIEAKIDVDGPFDMHAYGHITRKP